MHAPADSKPFHEVPLDSSALHDRLEPPPSSEGPPSTISPRVLRVEPIRRSSIPPPPDIFIAQAVTELLLAAAHADSKVCRKELKAVRQLTRQLLNVEQTPDWVLHRIETFDPNEFDIEHSVRVLVSLPTEQKRHILELARRVCDSDNSFNLEEESYLMSLVPALQLTTEDVADLVIEPNKPTSMLAKRIFDIAFSGTFLLLGWPLLLLIGLAVVLTSKGPPLFIQRRYGEGGKIIRVWKFRTMTVAEDGDVVKQAKANDSRLTPIGGFLRRTSLDELPQFINVLLGDMSVVGPRPHAVAHNEFYRKQILEYMLRHKVKPGITGLAQVNGWRGETDTLDKMVQRVAFDLEYIRRQSFWLDVQIVIRTVLGRTSKKNAY